MGWSRSNVPDGYFWGSCKEGDSTLVTLKDNGIGISDDALTFLSDRSVSTESLGIRNVQRRLALLLRNGSTGTIPGPIRRNDLSYPPTRHACNLWVMNRIVSGISD